MEIIGKLCSGGTLKLSTAVTGTRNFFEAGNPRNQTLLTKEQRRFNQTCNVAQTLFLAFLYRCSTAKDSSSYPKASAQSISSGKQILNKEDLVA